MTTSKPSIEEMLTLREQVILSLVASGLSSKQIADRLDISAWTVANHRKNMLAKTRSKSSAELIQLYNNNYYMKNSHL